MYERILVAYDGAYNPRRALETGVEFAKRYGAKLFILTVVPDVFFPAPVFPEEGIGLGYRYPLIPVKGLRKELTDYPDKAEKAYIESLNLVFEDILEKQPNLEVDPKLARGKPSSVIIEMAEAEDVDLIIMGCRRLNPFLRLILGSTTRAVAEACETPVMIVKTETETES